jgi:hypothetical protein
MNAVVTLHHPARPFLDVILLVQRNKAERGRKECRCDQAPVAAGANILNSAESGMSISFAAYISLNVNHRKGQAWPQTIRRAPPSPGPRDHRRPTRALLARCFCCGHPALASTAKSSVAPARLASDASLHSR